MKILDEMHRNVLKRILELKDKNNYSDAEFGRVTGLGEKAIDNWKRGFSNSYMKNLDTIANLFNVSSYYLLYGNNIESPIFSSNNESDISKQLDNILEQLENPQIGNTYNGTPISNVAKTLLIKSIKSACEKIKTIEKQKSKKHGDI